MKKICCFLLLLVLCISSVPVGAATVNIDAGETISFFPYSTWYVKNDAWLQSGHSAERDENGNVYISVDDFRGIFRCNISYSYDELSVYVQHKGHEIWQGLNTPVMFVDHIAYDNPAPYISSEGGAVMIPVEPYASVFGYQGNFSIPSDYAPGKMTLTLPAHTFTINKIEVNKAMQLVVIYGTDKAGTTMPVKYFPCSTGNPTSITPNGTYSAKPLRYFASSNPWYYFALNNCWVLYCTQITGDVCFHSIPINNYGISSLSQSGFNAIGRPASHGCIRLMVEDARFIWENCRGIPVVISEGYDDDTLQSIKSQILQNRPTYSAYVSSLKGQY